MLPEELERRITFPDVIREIERQTDGLFRQTDFMPLPCAHPNCHSLAYAYRRNGTVIPLTRLIDAREHLDLLANGITFNRAKARELIEGYLGKAGCCGGNCGTSACDPGEPDRESFGFGCAVRSTADAGSIRNAATRGGLTAPDVGRRVLSASARGGFVAVGRVSHHDHVVPRRVQL